MYRYKCYSLYNYWVLCTGPEDVYDGNQKLILGLIWTLIKTYQIKSSGKKVSTKKAMLAWINIQIPMYRIQNFSTDWNNGKAVCGLVDQIKSGLCKDHMGLDKSNGLENCTQGMDLAEKHLKVCIQETALTHFICVLLTGPEDRVSR